MFFDVLGKCLQVFKKKVLIFKVTDFLKMKTLSCERHACARPKSPIFWNWVPEYIPDLQKCVGFQNSKKMLNHSTLVYSMVSTTHCKHALAMSVTDLHTVTSTNSSQWCNRLAYTWVNSLPTIIWLPAYNLNLSLLKRMQRYMSGFCLHISIIYVALECIHDTNSRIKKCT